MSLERTPADERRLLAARLIIGLIQGAGLYLLERALHDRVWPAERGLLFAPLLLVFLFIPPLASQGLGELRRPTLIWWTATAAIVLALLAAYDVWSAWPQEWFIGPKGGGWRAHVTPSPEIFVVSAAGLFIAHALVTGADIDRRFMARYATHFDVAWKLAVQAALSAAFVGLFWVVLELGAALFSLIHLSFFQTIIRQDWFAIPATALAAAGALHLTDVRPVLVRGVRTLALVLFSWLLPLLVLIVAAFLLAVGFKGLNLLWSVAYASALMLVAAAVLIVLLNAAYQDGEPERRPPTILRWAGSAAAVVLVPLCTLAACGLWLRARQYGWTDHRIQAAACVVVACVYAVGYLHAAIPRGPWMKRIEVWNFGAALLILAILLALFSPVASPARLAVADQMARLRRGQTPAEKFDVNYLRWRAGRYGMAPLRMLAAKGPPLLKAKAASELQATSTYEALKPTAPDLAARITVYPRGASLPASFLSNDWTGLSRDDWTPCLQMDGVCSAVLTDIDGDGRPEVLLWPAYEDAKLFQDDGTGRWRLAATYAFPQNCAALTDALKTSPLTVVDPLPGVRDLMVGGVRITAQPVRTPADCPGQKADVSTPNPGTSAR